MIRKKVACFIPLKGNSIRVPGKNVKILGDRPLFAHALSTVVASDLFDSVYVDTDIDWVKRYCDDWYGVKVIDREVELTRDSANGNDLLNHWVEKKPNYDIYFQVFATSPFLKDTTLQNCVKVLKDNDKYDSVFTATEEHTWFWYDGKPINYDPKVLPRSQDAKPEIRESTSLYGITKESLLKHKARIGSNPKIYIVDEKEGVDIDNEIDFEFAEKLLTL